MSALFSKSFVYAVQSTLYISLKGTSAPVLLREISENLGIPHPFLSKILQKLVHAGILSSHRGASGGFTLAQDSKTIRLQDIADSVDGPTPLTECLLGFGWCSQGEPCVIHDHGTTAKQLVRTLIAARTIDSISKEIALHHVSTQHSGPHHDTTPTPTI